MNCHCSVVLVGVAAFLAIAGSHNLPGVPSSLTTEERLTSAISASVAEEIGREFVEYMKTGRESRRLQELGDDLRSSHSQKDIFTQSLSELRSVDQFFACTMCRATVRVIDRTLKGPEGELTGPDRDAKTKKAVVSFCKYFNIQTERVCSGLFDLNWPILDYIFNNTLAESNTVCGILPISICQAQQSEYKLNMTIVGNTPLESNSNLPERSDKDFKVLHLTDIHYDPEYKAGSLAQCHEPICCRDALGTGADSSTAAGHWSDYRDCDSPKHLILNAFEHIKNTHKIDWIYQTGDVPPHNIWSTSKQGNKDMLTEIDALLTTYFPNIPVYPCLGNHEPHPTNVFGNQKLPAELSIDWLYEHVWSLWKKWLPKEAEVTVLRGGYYTVSPSAGQRIIAMNSMDCYLFNWWIFQNGSIVLEQLQWLHDTLLAAEKAGESVHILTHIPSGDSDCWSDWADEYNRLLARFSRTITGIFNGHTHKDEMNVHYAKSGAAVAVSWNGGSLTSYSDKNPNYRLYDLNPKTWQVLDHETWIFNLTEANQQPDASPKWYKEYTFAEDLTKDTSPAGVDKLLQEMAENPKLLRKFWRFKVTHADPQLNAGCDNDCLSSTLCRIATSSFKYKKRCRELQAVLKESLDKEKPEDDNDGASTMVAYSFTSLMALFCALRYLF